MACTRNIYTFSNKKLIYLPLRKGFLVIYIMVNNETYLGLYVKCPIFMHDFNKFLFFKHFRTPPI